MKKIMIFIGSYLPGTKSAGVTTSISNMVKELRDKYEFYIVTADRDIGDVRPYTSVELEKWVEYKGSKVFYSGRYLKSFKVLCDIINSIDVDIYYFNGFYNLRDTARVLLLYKLKFIPKKTLIIAPRGIFSMGEFNTHKIFRKIYEKIFVILKLQKNVYWHATSNNEKNDILRIFPNVEEKISVIENLSGIKINSYRKKLSKKVGTIKIIFISRISEKKNIKYIIDVLKKVTGNIEFNLYGMIGTEEDKRYGKECEQECKKLPNNIKVIYHGEIDHDKISEVYSSHHLFFFPTFGENYGHVIAESLANGCPILLSDTTPWCMLEKYNAGWIYSLGDKERFIKKLQELINCNQEQWNKYSCGALNAAQILINPSKVKKQYYEFFDKFH